MAYRKMRAFKRWMKDQRIECSNALDLVVTDDPKSSMSYSVYVKALCDLHEGDVVAKIPKSSCLSVKTSRACNVIEEAGLDGHLGLSVALMYEISLGPLSRWFGYLQMLPQSEPIPLVWSTAEIDSILAGTELQKIVKEDKGLMYEDWKEVIQPLVGSSSLELDPNFFGIEQYFAARSLIASRAFEIDDYHGYGMVPLADLFNHKTDAEDVHFTTTPSQFDSSSDDDDSNNKSSIDEDNEDADSVAQNSNSATESLGEIDAEISPSFGDDPTILEMIMVKDVKAGDEVFNTYGSSGNAALLHRYGFTEPDNPYDIVNIDLELVLLWCSSLFSDRHTRTRLSLWRKLGYSGCKSQNSEYFEISFDGKPQVDLLFLIYIMLLKEEEYFELDLAVSTNGVNKLTASIPLGKGTIALAKSSTLSKKLQLSNGVCKALLYLADLRESLYHSSSLEDDIESLNKLCPVRDRKLYHSLQLRISERKILEKLRSFASGAVMDDK